ncbi:hypothetical protein GQ53DRAFT_854992 [Thozetella sp. PMI_491]|nr:hypothetical protein GQ53DRAFT_854992 [Thozetella sp. PMI_491]
MKFLINVFLLALAALFAAAESELAHAMELVLMYSKYKTERFLFSSDYWVAAGCVDCDFNKFVSYLKRGVTTNAPEIIEGIAKFDWTDKAKVQTVVTKMATMPDPAQPSKLYMAGDFAVFRVNNGYNGFKALFENFLADFDKEVTDFINGMTDATKKATATDMLTKSNTILGYAKELRGATMDQKLYEELIKKFSPTGQNDLVYQYQDESGATKRWDPIKWVPDDKTLWGRKYTKIDLQSSRYANPQMLDPILKQRIKDHVSLFEKDGTNGRGAGLINYDPQYPGTNGRHKTIVNAQKKLYDAFPLPKNCKK